jgi:hypothetical protein
MRWDYLIALALSLPAAGVSYLFAFVFNPVTVLMLNAAAPLVRLCNRTPALQGFSGMGPAMWFSMAWPLMVVPVHYVVYVQLKGSHGLFAAVLTVLLVATAFGVLMYHAGS